MVYSNDRVGDKPILFVLVGIPASGKTYAADKLEVNGKKPVIHSLDDLRKEMFGSELDQSHNGRLFAELNRRVCKDLKSGKDVVYDATNINKKLRVSFLNDLHMPCYKVCLMVMTPYERCLSNNKNRTKIVQKKTIKNMYFSWNPPSYDEGFDDIAIYYNYDSEESRDEYTLENYFKTADKYKIDKKKSLGNHSRDTGKYLRDKYPDDVLLCTTGLIHDLGKLVSPNQYNCAGAYDSMFYTDVLGLSVEEKLEVANLIYYQTMPQTAWKQSANAKAKAKQQLGENMFKKILMLSEANLAAS